jgi:ABC-type multidrug transport system fused ATPase/permease subunit
MLQQVFKKYKFRLLITYLLFSIEMIGLLMRPFFLGKAIDGLVLGNNWGLYELIAIHLLWIVVGVARHQYDTRTYSAIYTSLVVGMLSKKNETTNVSKLAAHSTLAREFIDFIEFDLIYVIEAFYSIVGSLILLFFYDKKVVGICLLILVPVSILSYFYGKKMKNLNKNKNDELEQQVDIIGSGSYTKIENHYNLLKKWQIKISDQEAINFGAMELLVLVVIAFSLYITSNISHAEAIKPGVLIGIYSYISKFTTGLETIPYTVQRLSNLQDITRRIEGEV